MKIGTDLLQISYTPEGEEKEIIYRWTNDNRWHLRSDFDIFEFDYEYKVLNEKDVPKEVLEYFTQIHKVIQ